MFNLEASMKPLLNELIKFGKGQQEIITLLKENNDLQKLILLKLGG
jgi:hypothetical protein